MKNQENSSTKLKKYAKNEAKWKAAEEFCKNRGWHFLIQDEYDLGIKKKRKNDKKSSGNLVEILTDVINRKKFRKKT